MNDSGLFIELVYEYHSPIIPPDLSMLPKECYAKQSEISDPIELNMPEEYGRLFSTTVTVSWSESNKFKDRDIEDFIRIFKSFDYVAHSKIRHN
jgi:hypothetical protein